MRQNVQHVLQTQIGNNNHILFVSCGRHTRGTHLVFLSNGGPQGLGGHTQDAKGAKQVPKDNKQTFLFE